MTEKNLAAHRRSARKSRGPATPEGKERTRDASLRHGFYSQDRDKALRALGEDPAEFDAVVKSLHEKWQPADGFEELLVMRLARAIWRMERSDRMQEGLAVNQIKELDKGRATRRVADFERLQGVWATLKSMMLEVAEPSFATKIEHLQCIDMLGKDELKELGNNILVYLYQLIRPRPEGEAPEAGEPEPSSEITAQEGLEREATRLKLYALLTQQWSVWEKQLRDTVFGLGVKPTAYERAAELAPSHPRTMLMMRMEDASFRQIWRTTNLLLKIKRQAQEQENCENTQVSGYVDDIKGS
jgi:hypothetical protein